MDRRLRLEIWIGRIFVSLLMAVTIVLVGLEVLGMRTIEPWRSPQDELKLNPLAAEMKDKVCQVYDDANGTVHLLTNSDLDAAACFGWAHGRDRAWQMDHFRRIARARSAEVFGWRSLRSDFIMSLLEIEHHARRIFAEMDPEHRRLLWAYAFGVNRALIASEAAGGNPEFSRLRTKVRGWHPVDTIALLLLQSFDQTRKGFETDLSEAERLAVLGPDLERLNRGDGLPWDVSVLKAGEYPMRRSRGGGSRRRQELEESSTAATESGAVPARRPSAVLARPSSPGEGSNNWVLAPSRSHRGTAWLANDPHLALTRPAFWHWVHVKGSGVDVIGASFPGIPLVVSGTNRRVSWGLTNSYLDSADLVRIPEARVRSEGEWHRPWIPLRVGSARIPFFFLRYLKLEERFPVLPFDPDEQGRVLALRWSGFFLGGSDLGAIFDLMKVKTVGEADQLLSKVGIPSWNYVFADVEGGIGYRAVGRIPRRFSAPSAGVHEPASDGAVGWPGSSPWLNADEMPHALNPRRGYLVTANNRQWPTDGSLHGGRAYAPGFRAFRAEELLLQKPRHDMNSLSRIQCDVQAVDLRFLIPELLSMLEGEGLSDTMERRSPAEAEYVEALKRLIDWSESGSFIASEDCSECAVARRWIERLEERTMLDPAGHFRWARIARQHPLESQSMKYRTWVRESLLQALDDLQPEPWRRWGDRHVNPFSPLNPALSALPVAGFPMSTPGDEHSLNPGTSVWDEDAGVWKQTHGASQRLLVEMTNPPSVYVQLAGENRPAAPVWPDETAWRRWRDCGYSTQIFPLDFGGTQVAQQLKTVVF